MAGFFKNKTYQINHSDWVKKKFTIGLLAWEKSLAGSSVEKNYIKKCLQKRSVREEEKKNAFSSTHSLLN
jgi:hypothetical protein